MSKYLCRVCSKPVTATKNHRYRSHTGADGDSCEMSSEPIPEGLEPESSDPGVPKEGADFSKCPHCTRAVKLTRLGYFEPHDSTLRGGDRCPNSGVRFRPLKPTTEVPLPGDEIPARGVYNAGRPTVTAQMEVEGVPRTPVATSAPAAATPPAEAAALASEGVSTEIDWSDVPPPAESSPASSSSESPGGFAPPPSGGGIEAPATPVGETPTAPEAASSGASTETSSPESESTSTPSPAPTLTPFRLGISYSTRIFQPMSPFLQPPEYKEPSPVFLQPTEYNGPEKPEEMTPEEKVLAAQIKETFYAYDNRKSSDNRSAQTTLGPSEIGTPCDRRLAMALMGIPPVNPGGDGWAAFVGTCGHEGMAQVYRFADAGTGRYAVEIPVHPGTPTVPKGTSDLLDRRDARVVDWKFMGAYSLKKFKLEGPSQTYKVQAQVYGYGAERNGERVKEVAIVGLPRAGGSLDEMWVRILKYDKKVAIAALNRVEGIAQKISRMSGEATVSDAGPTSPMEAAQSFGVADPGECKWCPFHLKGDKRMERGCPGP